MNYISKEGLEKLKQELENRVNMRSEISKRIQDAKAYGDLSENSEYTEAMEAYSFNEGRIEELKEIVKNAVIVEGQGTSSGVIEVGSKIEVDSKFGRKEFIIVGSSEANPAKGFISNESPLGLAFIGKKKGDIIIVNTPSGVVEYNILEVK